MFLFPPTRQPTRQIQRAIRAAFSPGAFRVSRTTERRFCPLSPFRPLEHRSFVLSILCSAARSQIARAVFGALFGAGGRRITGITRVIIIRLSLSLSLSLSRNSRHWHVAGLNYYFGVNTDIAVSRDVERPRCGASSSRDEKIHAAIR